MIHQLHQTVYGFTFVKTNLKKKLYTS